MPAKRLLNEAGAEARAIAGTLLIVGTLVGCKENPVKGARFTGGAGSDKAKVGAAPEDAGIDGATSAPQDAGIDVTPDAETEPAQGGPDAALDVSLEPVGEFPPVEPPPDEPTPSEPSNEPQPNFPRPDGVAPWSIQSGDAVFFVGNSFLGGTDDRLADLVASLGAAMQPAVTIRTGQHVVYGNQPLSWFFQQPESQNAIQSGQFEIFVLQGEEREPVDKPEPFKQAVRDYYGAVTAKGGTIMLFMTWDITGGRDTAFFQKVSLTYDEMGRELNVPVIPVGLIYDDCNRDPYGNEQPYWLLNDDLLHQNDMGTAVNTYATFAMLTGINPQGQRFAGRFGTLAPELLTYLSDKSWARVAPRLGL